MKKNIGKKLKDTKGITLVALIVTIIVLLILAAVSLSAVFSQDGIFSRAEQSTEKYGQAKARETLELTLSDAQMKKYESGLTDEQLSARINEIGEELEERENQKISQVIVEGYIFSIDRTVPKILEYLGKADGVIITGEVKGLSNGWMKPSDLANINVIGKIKTYSGGQISNVKATKNGTEISGFSIDSEGRYTIGNITADTTIEISAKDDNNNEGTKIIPITIKIDNIVPTLSEVTATVQGRKITISGVGIDKQSGLKHINYTILPTTVKEGATGILKSGDKITLNATTSEEYTIKFTSEDNVGNKSEEQIRTVETIGEIKHINSSTGLKEVNTIDIYGVTIKGYICDRADVEWQLFYIDEDDNHRVYLISKDYMAPPTRNTQLISSTNDGYSKAYTWSVNVLNNFTGIVPTNTFTRKFLNDYIGVNASTYNLQATNYMLDQSIWGEYMNKNKKSDYAFGGPTLPLFVASYNDVSTKAKKLYFRKSDSGYQIMQGNSEWSRFLNGVTSPTQQYGLYLPKETKGTASGYWLASPANYDGSYLRKVRVSLTDSNCSESKVNELQDNGITGFRPIVACNSSVQFKDNEDGTYTIVN